MSMQPGVDSLEAPDLAQARQAARDGIKWWAGYVGGDNAAGVWPQSGWDALRKAGIKPLPIWVANVADDPAPQARQAMVAVQHLGLGHEVALDTEANESGPEVKGFVDGWNRALAAAGWTSVVYDGARYNGANYHGQAIQWVPAWDGAATAPAGSAHQYLGGAGDYVAGINVDRDVGAGGFPFAGAPSLNTIKVSRSELRDLAGNLVDCRDRTVSVHRQATALRHELPVQTPAAGPAEPHVRQAAALLDEIAGAGPKSLHHLVGELYDLDTFIGDAIRQFDNADTKPGGVPGQIGALSQRPRPDPERVKTIAGRVSLPSGGAGLHAS